MANGRRVRGCALSGARRPAAVTWKGMAAGKERSDTRRGSRPVSRCRAQSAGFPGDGNNGVSWCQLATFFLAATNGGCYAAAAVSAPRSGLKIRLLTEFTWRLGMPSSTGRLFFRHPWLFKKGRSTEMRRPPVPACPYAAPREIGGSRRAGNAPCRWPVPWPIRFPAATAEGRSPSSRYWSLDCGLACSISRASASYCSAR
jgi:hypothetical protein